jgi:hypothetical protein
MKTLDDPFQYPDKTPEWLAEIERQKQRAKRSKRLGRPIGNHGGRRPGAGRPTVKKEDQPFNLVLNSIQKKSLLELGSGDLNKGIQVLIDKYL